MKTVLIFAVAWLGLSAISNGVGKYVFDPAFDERMAKVGIQTFGMVTGKDRENRQLITYVFDVDGVQYECAGFLGESNPDFDQIEIGDQVIVVFDPVDPNSSILGRPEDNRGVKRWGVWFVTIMTPLIPMTVCFGIYCVVRDRRKQKLS